MIKHLYHYWLISRSGIFDQNYYLLTYPDVRTADVNPLWHFVKIGWKEGRNPTGFFDTKFYLENNPDVRIKGINPLVHYIKFGLKEGRRPRPEFPENRNDKSIKYEIHYPADVSQTSADEVNEIEQINATVSVIIPTKNAGEDFEFLLKMLKNQVGIKKIEIIIVDSGSQDNTVQIAHDYSARVISIPPEKFSHSYSRNIGALDATGDFLLFTVQDAFPPTNTWLNNLMSVLIKNDVTAVSCAELPREDADLFYRVISWNHYNFLDVNKHDKIFSMPKNPNHVSLRQNGQLSDLACLISREVFNQYHYRLNYAEDLDLGIRLIEDGHKIAFLGSTRIIHSHNRTAFYFLKRGYVDNLFLSDIFADFAVPQIKIEDLIPTIIFTYNFLEFILIKNLLELKAPITTEELITCVEKSIDSRNNINVKTEITEHENKYVDNQWMNFIKQLVNNNEHSHNIQNKNDILIQPLLGYFQITYNYLRNTYEINNKSLIEETIICFFKEFSILVGAYLAYCYLNNKNNQNNLSLQIHAILADGV